MLIKNKKILLFSITLACFSFFSGILLEHNRAKIITLFQHMTSEEPQSYRSDLDNNKVFKKLTTRFQPKWTFTENSEPEQVKNNILKIIRQLFPVSKEYRIVQQKIIDERLSYYFLESLEGIDTKIILGIPEGNPNNSKAILIVDDESSAEEIFGLTSKNKKDGRSIGKGLLDAGHIVCAVELKGFGYSRLPDSWWGQHGIYRWYSILKSTGTDLLSLHIRNCYDALQLLKDKAKGLEVGLCGISKAVKRIGILAAIDLDIKYLYAASGLSIYEDKYYSDVPHAYVKGQRNFFNYNDLFGALVGKKIRLSYGKKENLIYATEAYNNETYKYIKSIFKSFGKEDDITLCIHKLGHVYLKEDVVSFFSD